MKRISALIVIILLISVTASAQIATITKKTEGMKKYEGYFNFYWDDTQGKIWLEIDDIDKEFLYQISLSAGLGSNEIGLDRAQLGDTKIVQFRRTGPKILLVEQNYTYRANSDNDLEVRAVKLAFAESAIWGFKVAAEENDRILVDATAFFMRDAHGVIGSLKRSNQGNYKLDASRSAMFLPMTKNFPLNTEFETTLTYTGDNPGRFVRSVAPDANSITLRQHHSFVKLPEDGYQTRKFDPRSGYGSMTYLDYATPIDQPITKKFTRRHHLEKKNPNARVSEAVEPIIYYVDSGAPEPIKSALVEGASWWNQAFEAIGYKDAFQVKVLPGDVDPMDVRYNVINWVHRSTRGWSYGSSVTDPRTGEIIKGHVTLGSLRVRQDFLIAEALMSPYEDGTTIPKEMEEMALARVRQLSAHEVGHTIGISHNYISSADGRTSVMDYPHPLVKLDPNGNIDLSDAYTAEIGDWDNVTIAFGYQDFPDGTDEDAALTKILEDAFSKGMRYVSDTDSRAPGSSQPYSHLWDNGKHPVDELERMLEIRSKALENFSENNIRNGAPLATLEEKLVPIYLFHRYQVEAASKVLGGMEYEYKLRGDNLEAGKIVSPEEQRCALNILLTTLSPDVLRLDERIINLILPLPPGYGSSPEIFQGRTGLNFDPLTPVESAADLTLGFIFNADRAARLVEYNARDPKYPGLGEVMDKVISSTWKSSTGKGLDAEINRVVNNTVMHTLMGLAANGNASYQARAVSMLKLEELKKWLKEQLNKINNESQKAHYFMAANEIKLFQENPDKVKYTRPLRIPNGSPIGTIFDKWERK